MAQHISIIQNNIYPKIADVIQNRFSKKNIGLSSFRYEELKSDDYKLFTITVRHIAMFQTILTTSNSFWKF